MKTLLTFLLALCASASATINVTSPVAGTSAASPVHVTASDSTAVKMAVYVDNVLAYSVQAKSIGTDIVVVPGDHNMVIQSWNSSGAVEKYSIALNVTDSGYTNSYKQVQSVMWSSCGSCGNSKGNTKPVFGSQTLNVVPNLSGHATKFSVTGKYPFTDYYWFQKNWTPILINKLRIEYDVQIPTKFASTPEALEFESQHRHDNYVYDFAMQLCYACKEFRIFDKAHSLWESTGVAFTPLTAGTWHHIVAEFNCDYTHHTLQLVDFYVDANKYYPTQNAIHNAFISKGLDYTTYGSVQLDMNSNADNYYAYYDNYTFSWR